MELRSKRSQSQPKPAAFQRRSIVDNSHRENLLRMLIIEPTPGDWWAKFYLDTSKIPLYILEKSYDEKLSIKSLAEMELVHEFIPPRKEFIVEEMSREHAHNFGARAAADTVCDAHPCRIVDGAGMQCAERLAEWTLQNWRPVEIL